MNGMSAEQYAMGEDLASTASRLELALRRKIGHIVVVGDDRYDVNIFVNVVLGDIPGYQVIELSAEEVELPDLNGLRGDPRTIAVVYDADLLSTTALEELRVWVENSPVALGLVLVGTSVLEQTLARPEVKVFAGLIHSRIVLVRQDFEQTIGVPSRSRPGTVSSFVVAGILAICIGFALGTPMSSQHAVVGALSDGLASSVAWVKNVTLR